jgi:hypothetical protein
MAEILAVGLKIAAIKNIIMLIDSKDTAIGYLHVLVLSLRVTQIDAIFGNSQISGRKV